MAARLPLITASTTGIAIPRTSCSGSRFVISSRRDTHASDDSGKAAFPRSDSYDEPLTGQ
jgi:hypothetical protein